MTLDELLALMKAGDMGKCISIMETHCLVKNVSDALKQYDPKLHKVMDPSERKDRPVKDDEGNITDYVKLIRTPLALQKKIVTLSAAFLGNPSIETTPKDDTQAKMIAALKKVWIDAKLNYRFKDLAKRTMSAFQAAELWYFKDVEPEYWADIDVRGKYKPAIKVLAHHNTDALYPVFDEYNDMIAFGVEYKIKLNSGKDEHHFDVYTAEQIYYTKKEGSVWLFADENKDYSARFKGIPNIVKKIPIVYYYQPLTEWDDVQALIDRLEEITSNHGDTNDYVGNPAVFVEGEIEAFPSKSETGKVFQTKNGGKVSYLSYDAQPKSVEMEINNLWKYIHTLTHTPDISFEQMKGLGYFSTVALQTMFMDAHLKAADKEVLFGEGIQRRINYLKAAMVIIDGSLSKAATMDIQPKFEYFLPKNIQELVQNLVSLKNAGLISQETAVAQNDLVSDPVAEIEKIKKEAVAAASRLPVK